MRFKIFASKLFQVETEEMACQAPLDLQVI